MAVASLVLGIGLNTTVFSLWNSLFLNPLPVRDLATLAAVDVVWRNDSGEYAGGPPGHSHDNFLDIAAGNRSFTDLALYQWHPMSFLGGGEPVRATGMFVTSSYFPLLGIQPDAGRFFRPEEDEVGGGHDVAVLSHGCWSRLFGADPEVIGRVVEINGTPFTVVGVGPPRFRGIEVTVDPDFWLPVATYPRVGPYAEWFEVRGVGIFRAIGRLRPGVTLADASADVMRLSRELEERFGKNNEGLGASAVPLLENTFQPNQRNRHLGYGSALAIGTGLILLIACINVANLLQARNLGRSRELAVRQALGADRRRLSTQLFVENMVLFAIGGVLSLPAGSLFLRLLWSLRPPEFPPEALATVPDGRVFAFSLLTTLAIGAVFGLLPAAQAESRNLAARLSQRGAPDASGHRRWHARRLLVVAQISLALAALIAAGLFTRSLRNAHRIELGFEAGSLAVLSIAPGDQGYDAPRARELYRRILERTRALPGVAAASFSENRLLRGGVRQQPVFLDGLKDPVQIGGRQAHRTNAVLPGFFDAAGIPLVAGDDFDDSITSGGPPVAIINETMARTLWPNEPAIGQRFRFNMPTDPPVEVVGVAADAKYRHVHEPAQFFIYLPEAQRHSAAMTLHVRAEGDPRALLPALKREIHELAPALPLADVRPLAEWVADDLWLEHAAARLLSLFGALALALAVLGVYGVASQSVRRRQHELAIRRALGATDADVTRAVIAPAVTLIATGVAIGWLATALALTASTRVTGLLYDVAVVDPAVYAAAGAVLFAVALAGSWIPGRRAIVTEPARVLHDV